jgi:hypothetical protein
MMTRVTWLARAVFGAPPLAMARDTWVARAAEGCPAAVTALLACVTLLAMIPSYAVRRMPALAALAPLTVHDVPVAGSVSHSLR